MAGNSGGELSPATSTGNRVLNDGLGKAIFSHHISFVFCEGALLCCSQFT